MANAFKKLISFTALLALLALPFYAYAQSDAIIDWWKLRDYSPPLEIAAIAKKDTMTEKAEHLFYINHPQLIKNKSQFRKACPQNEQTIVLGCYHANQNGIAIYDISDKRLSGVEEVTAAHEMLHAGYDRLSSSKKAQINIELKEYYNNGLKDKRIADVIEAYKKTEPNDVVNEMHSVFATEVADLPRSLENYYRDYFNNRQKVVNFSKKYQSVFEQNKRQLSSLKSRIDNLKNQLDNLKNQIDSEQNGLESENQRMQNMLSSGNNRGYNAAVGPYNARVETLQVLVSQYNSMVETVNSLVRQYNNLAYTQESLFDSLDTRVQTQQVQ